MSKRLVVFILVIIIMIAGGLRLYGLDNQSLWYDEVTEETGFQRQFLNMQGITPYSPPLHLFFIYPVTKMFPKNDFALRMVPLIFALLNIPLLFLLVKRMFNEKVALLTIFLLAISPYHIWYSQEARMFALQWMLALLSLIFFLRTLEKPKPSNYIGYILSITAGLYTIQLTVFLMIIHALYLLVFMKKYSTQIKKWAGAFGLIIIFYIPYIIFTINSFERMNLLQRQTDFTLTLPYTFFSYMAGFSIGPSLRELHIEPSLSVLEPYLYIIIPLLLTYGILIVLGFFSLRKDRSNIVLLALIIAVPIIGTALLSTMATTIRYNVRYTGIALFGFLIIIAKGIDWISYLKPNKLAIISSTVAIIMVTGFSAYSYTNYHFVKKYQKPDIRSAVTYIAENKMPDDAFLCIENVKVFNRYSDNDPKCITISGAARHSKQLVDSELLNMFKGKKRLWMVLSTNWYAGGLINYIQAILNTNYTEIKNLQRGSNDFANIQIYCYDLTKNGGNKK